MKRKYKKYAAAALMITALMLFTVPMLALFGSRAAVAGDTSACYNIADSDRRTFCLAKAHKDRSYCNSIKAAEIRAQCLAEVESK